MRVYRLVFSGYGSWVFGWDGDGIGESSYGGGIEYFLFF